MNCAYPLCKSVATGHNGPEYGLRGANMRALLVLVFLGGCSLGRYYQGLAVSQELRKNATSLELVIASVETDFEQKEQFLDQFHVKGKDPFIKENLDQKLKEMNLRREVIEKSAHIRNLNNGLLNKIENKSKIKESDPEFRAIENFANNKDKELSFLMKEFSSYKKASEEFEKLAFFTRMVKN
jgi:hypothetical protein